MPPKINLKTERDTELETINLAGLVGKDPRVEFIVTLLAHDESPMDFLAGLEETLPLSIESSDEDIDEWVFVDKEEERYLARILLTKDDPYTLHKIIKYMHLALSPEILAEYESLEREDELEGDDLEEAAAILDIFRIFGERRTIDESAARRFVQALGLAFPLTWTTEFKSMLSRHIDAMRDPALWNALMKDSDNWARMLLDKIDEILVFVDAGAVVRREEEEQPTGLVPMLVHSYLDQEEAKVKEIELTLDMVDGKLMSKQDVDITEIDWEAEKLKVWQRNLERKIRRLRKSVEKGKQSMVSEIIAKAIVEIFMAQQMGVANYEEAIGEVYGLSVSEEGRRIINAIKMRFFREDDKQIFARLVRSKDPVNDLHELLGKEWGLDEIARSL